MENICGLVKDVGAGKKQDNLDWPNYVKQALLFFTLIPLLGEGMDWELHCCLCRRS